MSLDNDRYIRRLLVTIGVTALALGAMFALWQLASVLLLLFGGALFGVFLTGLASPLQRVLSLPKWGAVLIAALLSAGLLALFGSLAGPAIAEQMVALSQQFSDGLKQMESFLMAQSWGEPLLNWAREQWEQAPLSPKQLMGQVTSAFSVVFGVFADLFVMLFIGFYLALHPNPYTRSVLFLFPESRRKRVQEVLNASYQALKWWLIGRASSMAIVAVLTAIGLWLLGVELVLALAFLAGLLSFVPFIGPIAAAVPAILVGFIDGPTQAMYVVIVYFVVQLLESNILTPYVQTKAVSLPPAVMLSGQLLMGAIFGLQGLALSTPLLVFVIVLVQLLYVQDVLKEDVQPLGQ